MKSKVWSASAIRKLARSRQEDSDNVKLRIPVSRGYTMQKNVEPHVDPDDFDLEINPETDAEDVHRFSFGRFQEAMGDRVVLVCADDPNSDRRDEMKHLCKTLGLVCVKEEFFNRRKKVTPKTFLGSGFLSKIRDQMRILECTAIVLDAPLTPVQVRNLESFFDAPVLDREGVILSIFERHAKTSLAKMQVELARLKYLQPRLTGIWSGLSRQRGARGGLKGRGLGETRLELDRRVIRDRITALAKKLVSAEVSLKIQAGRRAAFPRVALVGYTNAGKSTMMQKLTGADVEASPRLFATLDTTIRALVPPTVPKILVSDTVGFVRDLPPGLVASFKSTLRETASSDLILHLVDVSHSEWKEQFRVTEKVLCDLGLEKLPKILVLNKIDMYEGMERIKIAEARRFLKAFEAYAHVVTASALLGQGIPELKELLRQECRAELPIWSRHE